MGVGVGTGVGVGAGVCTGSGVGVGVTSGTGVALHPVVKNAARITARILAKIIVHSCLEWIENDRRGFPGIRQSANSVVFDPLHSVLTRETLVFD